MNYLHYMNAVMGKDSHKTLKILKVAALGLFPRHASLFLARIPGRNAVRLGPVRK